MPNTTSREEEKRAQSVPRYFWQQNYETEGESMHWALNDTHSTREGKVSCCYMVLFADYPTCIDGKPLSEQSMPKRIVDLLNGDASHSAQQAKVEGLVRALEGLLKKHACANREDEERPEMLAGYAALQLAQTEEKKS